MSLKYEPYYLFIYLWQRDGRHHHVPRLERLGGQRAPPTTLLWGVGFRV